MTDDGRVSRTVKLRTCYVDELTDRPRQLRCEVDLVFAEFTRHVRINTAMATAILTCFPRTRAFAGAPLRDIALLAYNGRHRVGEDLAHALIEAVKVSVAAHHCEPYEMQMKYICADIETLVEMPLKN